MNPTAWCLSLALAATNPASAPTPAPAEPSYYVKLWAQDDQDKKVWELGLATREEERANVTDGYVTMFLIPHQQADFASGKPVTPKNADISPQEVTNGVQLSVKVAARADARCRAELTWSWSRPLNNTRQMWGADRLDRNGTLNVTVKQGAPTLINQLSSPNQQSWKVYLQVDPLP